MQEIGVMHVDNIIQQRQDQCLAGYNLGFPQGCIGVNSKHDDYAEYTTCFDYLNATQK